MSDFVQFFEANEKSAAGRFRFNAGDIVLVKGSSSYGNSTLPLKYSRYINKIGIIKGREPRSMASPYYNLELEDGTEVKITGVFLRGPYKNRETVLKYQADPNIPDSPEDIVYSKNPIDPKIRGYSLEKMKRDLKLEEKIKINLPDFQWIDESQIIGTTSGRISTFNIAYMDAVIDGRSKRLFIQRANDVVTGKIINYVLKDHIVFSLFEHERNELDYNIIKDTFRFPFKLSHYRYSPIFLKNESWPEYISHTFFATTRNNIVLYKDFVRLQKQGNEGLVDFYLNENGVLQSLLRAAEINHIPGVFGGYMAQQFNRKLFTSIIKNTLIEQGILKDQKLNMTDHINLFVSDIQ